MPCDVLLNSHSPVDLEQYESIWNDVVPRECRNSPPWRSGPGACRGFLQVLNKKAWRGGVDPLWRLSCNFTRTTGGLDLAKEDKGTPHVVDGSSSPMRARTATWVPGDTWHWVLLCVGDVTVCCCSIYCCCKMYIQGSVLLTKGPSQRDWLHVDCEVRDPEGVEFRERAN